VEVEEFYQLLTENNCIEKLFKVYTWMESVGNKENIAVVLGRAFNFQVIPKEMYSFLKSFVKCLKNPYAISKIRSGVVKDLERPQINPQTNFNNWRKDDAFCIYCFTTNNPRNIRAHIRPDDTDYNILPFMIPPFVPVHLEFPVWYSSKILRNV
jgi:hypothetical protein